MRYKPFLILCTLLLVTCKKQAPVTDRSNATSKDYAWKQVPSSSIFLGDRYVLAINAFDSVCYVQTEGVFYRLDTNFTLKDATISGPRHRRDYLTFPKIAKTHTSYSDGFTLWVKDNWHPVNSIYSISIGMRYYDSIATEMLYTNVDSKGIFRTLHASQQATDTVSYHLNTFQMLEPWVFAPPVKLNSKLTINISRALHPRLFGIHQFGNVVFCSIDGSTYRVENDVVTDTIQYDLRQIVKKDGLLYSTTQWVYYFNSGIERKDGLVVSKDNGKTWSYVATGSSFAHAYFRCINNELFLFTGKWIAHVDIGTGLIKKLNTQKLDAYVRDIAKVGSKVAVGTDAGVYYMNWDIFLNSGG